jgi:hypothetical protein
MRDERRRRPRRALDQAETLRRWSVTAAVGAIGLNALLFAQTGLTQVGAGDVQASITTFIGALFPGTNLRAPAQSPSAATTPAVVTTGAS